MSTVKSEPSEPDISFNDDPDNETAGFVLTSSQALLTALKPYAPQIVPIVVALCFIPLILALSGFAGYVVWNSLSAKWETPLYLQYGDGVPPYAHVQVQGLHPQQRYDISLHLKLPATQSNFDLGNFMSTVTLSTLNNATLASARRAALVLAPKPLWVSGTPNVISLDVPIMSNFVPGASAVAAHVELGRVDGWKSIGNGEGRELSVVSASIRGLVIPHGIRGIAIKFPLLSAMLATFTFLSILTIILGTCILPIMLPAQLAEEVEGEEKPKKRAVSASIAFPSYEKMRRKRKSHARRATSEGSGIKQEETFTMIPPAEEPSPEPRIRQRRTSTKREVKDEDSDN